MGTFLETINITTKQNTAFSTTIVPPAGYKLGHIHIVDSAGIESEIDVPTAQALSYLLSLPLPPQKIDVCVFKDVSNFTNLDWKTNSGIPNQANPFAEDNVGWTWGGNFVLGGNLRNKDTSDFLKLKTGNEEAIIEFYYFSNTFTAGDRVATYIEFVGDSGQNRSFGIARCNHCFAYGGLHQVYAKNVSIHSFGYFYSTYNCAPTVLFPGLPYQIDVPFIDASRMGQTYPKTKFKMRMINGIYELYKNDILVGSVAYDNTIKYTFSFSQFGNATNVNMGIQVIKVEGNFE